MARASAVVSICAFFPERPGSLRCDGCVAGIYPSSGTCLWSWPPIWRSSRCTVRLQLELPLAESPSLLNNMQQMPFRSCGVVHATSCRPPHPLCVVLLQISSSMLVRPPRSTAGICCYGLTSATLAGSCCADDLIGLSRFVRLLVQTIRARWCSRSAASALTT
jgi:hypothetical protein